MNIGDKLYLEPTIPTSAFVTTRTGPQPCRVIAVNADHRHFTVQFDFPGGFFRECYKMEEAPA